MYRTYVALRDSHQEKANVSLNFVHAQVYFTLKDTRGQRLPIYIGPKSETPKLVQPRRCLHCFPEGGVVWNVSYILPFALTRPLPVHVSSMSQRHLSLYSSLIHISLP